MACVSGSPNRALHSSRTGPSVGQHQARVQGAAERGPATGQLGQDRAVDRGEQARRPRRRADRRPGCRPPSRPCSVPCRRRRVACGRARPAARSPRRPSQSAMRLASRPTSRSSTTTTAPGSVQHGPDRVGRGPDASSQTVTPLPAARPSALTTQPAPPSASRGREGDRRLGFGERRGLGHPDARPPPRSRGRTPCSTRSGRPPGSARRPRSRPPRSASATPAARGASGPTTTSSAATDARDRHDRGAVQWIHRHAADPWLRRDPGTPRRHDDLVHARLAGQLPGQRVLATATADDQDPGRHDQAHATIPVRLRIGRQARSIVWVRSGPTETSTMGTPACDSMALT